MAPPVHVEVILLRPGPVAGHGVAYRVVSRPLPDGADPDATATAMAGSTGPEHADAVAVLHSTSWRFEPARGVVLTYAALPDPDPSVPAVALHAPSVVCSGDPLRPAPDVLHEHHVAAHAVRHLSYLIDHDPGIAATADAPRLAGLWAAIRGLSATMPTAPHALAHRAAENAAGLALSRVRRPG